MVNDRLTVAAEGVCEWETAEMFWGVFTTAECIWVFVIVLVKLLMVCGV